ncbi:MAG: (2Fe-2S) ferredoxin domain-containing protein [Magnetococcales bacterium]|nr:(2Fe-2S) ferredoxin domain-containing protein [Magnetococcales bacterium]
MKPKHHVFVCMNQRPPGHPRGSCGSSGASSIYEAMMGELEKRNLFGTIQVTGTFCMGPCDQGPAMVVYPSGVWYKGVKPEDVQEIFDQHLENDQPVERLVMMQ